VTDWLTSQLRSAVVQGRLDSGAKLPPTRLLAADLGVARGVVVEAYQRLVDEGLLSARPGSGTVVARRGPSVPARAARALPAARGTVPRLPLPTAGSPAGAIVDLSPGVPTWAPFRERPGCGPSARCCAT
jgi:GntR family transcriptional regulator/MocR family aminotransferase